MVRRQRMDMSEELSKEVEEICKRNIDIVGKALSIAIGNAIFEGYELGWKECLKHFKKNIRV